MKSQIVAALLLLLLLAVPAAEVRAADDDEDKGAFSYRPDKGVTFESADKTFKVRITNRVQIRYTHEDPDFGDSKGSFRIRRYKFKIDGHAFTHWKYKLQVNFAAGSVEGDNDALLEDVYLQYTKNHWVQPFMGQGKAYFSRQALVSSGKQQFVDRTFITSGGNAEVARQIGIGLVGTDKKKRYEYNFGIYNGDGTNSINQKENQNDKFLYVARFVWTPFGEYKLAESSLDRPDSSKLALGIAWRSDTITEDFDTGGPPGVVPVDLDVSAYGFEYAYKIKGFNTTGEWITATEDVPSADLVGNIIITEQETDFWYIQAGYLLPMNLEFAGRWAKLDPEELGALASLDGDSRGIAVSYYIRGHQYKVQADYRQIDFDDPVEEDFNEFRVQFQFAF